MPRPPAEQSLRSRIKRRLATGHVPPHLASSARTLLGGYASTPQLERLLERITHAKRRALATAAAPSIRRPA